MGSHVSGSFPSATFDDASFPIVMPSMLLPLLACGDRSENDCKNRWHTLKRKAPRGSSKSPSPSTVTDVPVEAMKVQSTFVESASLAPSTTTNKRDAKRKSRDRVSSLSINTSAAPSNDSGTCIFTHVHAYVIMHTSTPARMPACMCGPSWRA